MAGIVLDTTVLIDHMRRDEAASAWLEAIDDEPIASEVTRVEIVRGLRSGERAGAEVLFGLIAWVPVTQDIARQAGELGRLYRRSHTGIATADLIVAATARLLDARLATHNIRHFPMFKGLRPPY